MRSIANRRGTLPLLGSPSSNQPNNPREGKGAQQMGRVLYEIALVVLGLVPVLLIVAMMILRAP